MIQRRVVWHRRRRVDRRSVASLLVIGSVLMLVMVARAEWMRAWSSCCNTGVASMVARWLCWSFSVGCSSRSLMSPPKQPQVRVRVRVLVQAQAQAQARLLFGHGRFDSTLSFSGD